MDFIQTWHMYMGQERNLFLGDIKLPIIKNLQQLYYKKWNFAHLKPASSQTVAYPAEILPENILNLFFSHVP